MNIKLVKIVRATGDGAVKAHLFQDARLIGTCELFNNALTL